MTLTELNESLLLEWWAQDVAKSMKKKGTTGAFTQQCKDMGFQKSSMACIKHVEKEYDKAKTAFEAGEMSKKEYQEWALKKKRATLAKTFKKWGSKKKKANKAKQEKTKMKLNELLESKTPDTIVYGVSAGKKKKVMDALKNLQAMTPIFSYTVKDYEGDIGIYLKSGKNDDDFKDVIYKAVSEIDKYADVSE